MQTVKKIIADIIAKEGGYVNHPNDRGGPTNHGVTAMSYAEFFRMDADNVTIDDIKSVSKELAEQIYVALYYKRPNINILPELIQPIMLDMAVNHGRKGAVKILQQAINMAGINLGIPDGLIGQKTLAAANKAVDSLGQSFLHNLVNSRIQAYERIIEKDPTQAVFGEGWVTRAESFRPEVA